MLHLKVCTFSFLELLTWIKGRLNCIWKAWKVNEVGWGPSPSIPNVLHQATMSLLAQGKKESSPTCSGSSIRTAELSQLATDTTISYGIHLGRSSTLYRAYQVYSRMDTSSSTYLLGASRNHRFTQETFSSHRCCDTYFWKMGQLQLVTATMTSYGVRLGCSSTWWKDNEVYFPMDSTSPSYHLRVRL